MRDFLDTFLLDESGVAFTLNSNYYLSKMVREFDEIFSSPQNMYHKREEFGGEKRWFYYESGEDGKLCKCSGN